MGIHSYICMKPLLWNTQTARISQQIGSWGIFHLAWHEKWPSGNRCSVNASCKNLASIKLMTVILKLLEVIFQPLEVIFGNQQQQQQQQQQQKKNALKNWRHENHFYLGLIHGLAWTGCGSFCSNSSSNKGKELKTSVRLVAGNQIVYLFGSFYVSKRKLLQISIMSSQVRYLTANHWKDFRIADLGQRIIETLKLLAEKKIMMKVSHLSFSFCTKMAQKKNNDKQYWHFSNRVVVHYNYYFSFCWGSSALSGQKRPRYDTCWNKKHLFICPTSNKSKTKKN